MFFLRILAFILLLFPVAANAQSDEAALRAIIADFATAKNFRDTEAVVRKLAATGDPTVSLIGPHGRVQFDC